MSEINAVKAMRVSDEVAQQIRGLLASGALQPGDKLPAERDLATQLGVGRNAVREALRTLEMGGVVELFKGAKGGSFVSTGNPQSLSNGLRDLLSLRAVSIEQITQARVLIESAVTEEATRLASDSDFDALDAELTKAKVAYARHDYEAKLASLIEYHKILARATRNPVLIFVMGSIMDLMHDYSRTVGPERNDVSLKALAGVTEKLRQRDAVAAAAAMREHLVRLKDRYLTYQKRQRKTAPARAL